MKMFLLLNPWSRKIHNFPLETAFLRVILNVMTDFKHMLKAYSLISQWQTYFREMLSRSEAMIVTIRLSWIQLCHSHTGSSISLITNSSKSYCSFLSVLSVFHTYVKLTMTVLIIPSTVPDRVHLWKLE